MSHFLRFFDATDQPIALVDVEQAAQESNSAYRVDPEGGELLLDGELYAQIEINVQGDDLFEEEIEEMLDMLGDERDAKRVRVASVLRAAKRTICFQVLWGTRESSATLAAIHPITAWLLSTRDGLLHAEGEGYYDRGGLMFAENE